MKSCFSSWTNTSNSRHIFDKNDEVRWLQCSENLRDCHHQGAAIIKRLSFAFLFTMSISVVQLTLYQPFIFYLNVFLSLPLTTKLQRVNWDNPSTPSHVHITIYSCITPLSITNVWCRSQRIAFLSKMNSFEFEVQLETCE